MSARRLRLGIVGTGIAARDLHWPAIRRLDRFEIVALCNRTREKAEDYAGLIGGEPRITTNYQELLSWPEVEAVDLALPIGLSSPVAIDALRAGKHVILEKPIAANVDSARAIVDEANTHPELVILIAENVRYESRLGQARRVLDEGRIGKPIMFHSDVLQPLNPSSPYVSTLWRRHPEHLGGYLSDGGVHHTGALHALAGPVATVQGIVTSFHPERDPTDTLLANLRFVSGAVGHLTYSVGVAEPEPSPLRVYGSSGSLHIHHDHLRLLEDGNQETIAVPPGPSSYDLEFLDFYRAITEGERPQVGPEEGFEDLQLVDAIIRSAQSGMMIRLR